MKKSLTLALLSLFVTLIAIPICNAVVTPVEVERVKDVYFIRVKGDHHTRSFLFHYVNLSPEQQSVGISYSINGGKWTAAYPIQVDPGCSYDFSKGPYDQGTYLSFQLFIDYTLRLQESVVIPPKP